jgi:glycosyltransferase involved in cell wall biosynthesis
MPRGVAPTTYFHVPSGAFAREEFYRILDAFTWETFAEETSLYRRVGFVVPLPPLSYEGRFVKGLLYSSSLDLIIDRFPVLRELFVCIANSMWTSYPWATSADAYLVCYDNPHRSAWFRRTNPDRAHIVHLPVQDADFTNEYAFGPVPVAERDIDLLCVSRLDALKNVPMIASALLIYRKKYPLEPIRMTLIAGKSGAYDRERMSEMERSQHRCLREILGQPEDYIQFVDRAEHYKEMPAYYSRARALVLGSLLEGKSRSLNEAQSCNTPVICFKELNLHARGDEPSFAEGAGLTSPYDAEALADTIHDVLSNEDCFRPRASYLASNGRKRFLGRCLRAIEYFAKAIPDLADTNPWENLWLDLAVQDNYGVSLHDFLYGRMSRVSHASGMEHAKQAAAYYAEKYGM